MTTEFEQQAASWDRWAPFYDSPGAAQHWDAADDAQFLAAIAGDGRALELGVGTGRVALALAAHNIPVVGIDASPKMLAELEHKRGDLSVTTHLTDMAAPDVEEPFTLAYAAAGTFFSILTQDRQVECFASVASLLTPDGCFVIEASAPAHYAGTGPGVVVRDMGEDYIRIGARRYDPAAQLVHFQEIHFDVSGGHHLLSAVIRYVSPAELDLMASLAGMRLCERFGDWRKGAFYGSHHISVYTTA